ncbi:MAG: hypothetical protein WBB43_04400 [Limnoraphis sp.]
MKRKHLIWQGMTLLVGTMFFGTAIARELSEQEKTVVCRLNEVVAEAGRDGYELIFWPVVRKGPPRISAPLTIKLDPSVEYLFVGYCDENCSDVQLRIANLSGEELGAEEDVLSVLTFEPPYTDDYELSLRMADCTNEDGCFYGLGILAPKGAAVPYASRLPKELAQFELCDS